MNRQHATWRIALGTFALALAVLVGGLAAAPVRAETRQAAVDKANALIGECVANGGEPEADVQDDWVSVSCLYDDRTEYCFNYFDPPSTSCGEIWIVTPQLESPWGSIDLIDRVELIDGRETEPPAPVTDPRVAPLTDNQKVDAPDDDRDQDDNPSKKGKKGKKGMKGGKGRRT